MLSTASILIAAAALVILGKEDVWLRRLPNAVTALYVGVFFLYAVASGHTWSDIGWHLAVASATFSVTLLFFALGWLGGGDVKLWSAVMLWAGPSLALPALVVATLAGGVLGVLCWLVQKLLPKFEHTAIRVPLRLLSAERGVPYGVALALAGLLVLWARY